MARKRKPKRTASAAASHAPGDFLVETLRLSQPLVDNIGDGYFVVHERKIRYVSQRLLEITGFSREELIGRSFVRLLPRRQHEAARRRYPRVIAGSRTIRQPVEGHLRAKDGREIPVEMVWHRRLIEGEPVITVLARDMRDRLRAEAERRRLAEFEANMLRNANVPIIALDISGRFLLFNEAAERISGYAAEEVLDNDRMWHLFFPDPALRRRIRDQTLQAMRQGRDLENFETSIRTKSGQTRVVSWFGSPLADGAGRVVAAVGVGRDVTEVRQAQAAAERHRRQVEAVSAVSRAVVLADRLEDGLAAVPDILCKHVGADAVSLLLVETPDAVPRFLFGGRLPPSLRKVSVEGGLREARWSRRVLRTRQPVVVRDIRTAARRPLVRAYVEAGFRSGVVVPVDGRHGTVGALAFISKRLGTFTGDVEFLATIGREIGLVIEHGLLDKELENRHRRVEALNAAIAAVMRPDRLEEGLRGVPRILRGLLGAEAACLFLAETPEEPTRPIFDGDIPPTVRQAFREPGQPKVLWTRRVFRTGKPLVIDDLRRPPYPDEAAGDMVEKGYRSFVSVPIVGRSGILATLEFGSRVPGHFTEADVAFLTAVGREIGLVIERRLLEQQLEDREERLEAVTSQLARATEDERHQIAALLHDDLGQLLSLARVQTDLAVRHLGAPGRAADDLRQANAHIDRVLDRMRSLAGRLEPEILADFDLLGALRRILVGLAATREERIVFTARGTGPRPAPAVERALFRIAVEAARNALRHARARSVRVTATHRPDRLTLSVRDDGCGFNLDRVKSSSTGLGLRLMHDRARSIGADFAVRSARGKGTTVRVVVSLGGTRGEDQSASGRRPPHLSRRAPAHPRGRGAGGGRGRGRRRPAGR